MNTLEFENVIDIKITKESVLLLSKIDIKVMNSFPNLVKNIRKIGHIYYNDKKYCNFYIKNIYAEMNYSMFYNDIFIELSPSSECNNDFIFKRSNIITPHLVIDRDLIYIYLTVQNIQNSRFLKLIKIKNSMNLK